MGCHVGLTYAGAFGYADDIALVVPSLTSFKQMIRINFFSVIAIR